MKSNQQPIRWGSLLYLLEIEASAGNRGEFDRYKDQLFAAPTTPAQRAIFLVNLGQAYQRLHDYSRAMDYLARGRTLAVENGLHWLVNAADQSIATPLPSEPERKPLDSDSLEIASAIETLVATAVKV